HRRADGLDTIENFDAGRGETIDLVGFAGKKFSDLVLTQQDADVQIELGEGQRIVVKEQRLASLSADRFLFQDSFIAPANYVDSSAGDARLPTTESTIVLNGGAQGVSYTTDANSRLVASLTGTIYSHDAAKSNSFVIEKQNGVSSYSNALRGFKHGIDKIDLSRTGITSFSDLVLTKWNRATINGLSQIHGVSVSSKSLAEGGKPIELVYVDAIDLAQLDEADFIFAVQAPAPAGVVIVPPTSSNPPGVGNPIQPVEPTRVDADKATPAINVDPIPPARPIEIDPARPDVLEVGHMQTVTVADSQIAIDQFGAMSRVTTTGGRHVLLQSGAMSSADLGGNGDNEIKVTGGVTKLNVGDGDNTIELIGSSATVVSGNGNNRISSRDYTARITLGNGNNVVSGAFMNLSVGAGRNVIESTRSTADVRLGDGHDIATLKGGLETVYVGRGNYELEYEGRLGKLVFGPDIAAERLWFQHAGQDLQISAPGSTTAVTLKDWYAPTEDRPSTIVAGDGKLLSGFSVENLVQAMAAFSPPAAGTVSLTQEQQTTLQPVLAANWH
ncbi:MAG TPA: hypothetical protein VL494_08585, partial [Steroidobacteraceae bacterium]|nr:hypothetical protein [Steroidobacteraceae bacterium]